MRGLCGSGGREAGSNTVDYSVGCLLRGLHELAAQSAHSPHNPSYSILANNPATERGRERLKQRKLLPLVYAEAAAEVDA